jgi:hypothetical protein
MMQRVVGRRPVFDNEVEEPIDELAQAVVIYYHNGEEMLLEHMVASSIREGVLQVRLDSKNKTYGEVLFTFPLSSFKYSVTYVMED